MPLNHDIVGVDTEPVERTWTETDVLLYALAVGAGQEDPLAELEFTTENSAGVQLQVLPTFGNLIGGRGRSRSLGHFDPANLVHAEQAFTLHRPLPAAGTSRSVSRVTGIYDKGSAALVVGLRDRIGHGRRRLGRLVLAEQSAESPGGRRVF